MGHRSCALLAAVGFLSLSLAATDTTCYFPDGSAAEGNLPCYPDDNVSFCCGAGYSCSSNLVCIWDYGGGDYQYDRGTCTDQTWASPSCPNFCTTGVDTEFNSANNASGVTLLDCGSDEFCCVTGSESCCDNGSTFLLASASIFTTIGTETASSATTTSDTTSTSKTTSSSTASQTTSSASSSSSQTSSASPSTTSTTSAATSSAAASSDASSTGLSTGAKIGIGVGVPAAVLAGLGIGYFLFKGRNKSKPDGSPPMTQGQPEVHYQKYYQPAYELTAEQAPTELQGTERQWEMSAASPMRERQS